jgi:hypothetical protein
VIEQYNDDLLNAKWNYAEAGCTHTYDYACDDTCNNCGEVREAAVHRYNIYQKTDDEHWLVCECGKRELEYNFGHGYSRVCTNEEHWLECECGHIIDRGTHIYSDSSDRVCNECSMANTTNPIIEKEADGKYYYYVNGWRENITELVKIDGVWYYINNGVWDKTAKTLHKLNGKWFFVENGTWSARTTIVEYQGKMFYVYAGKWNADVTDLKKVDGKWYYIQYGKWNQSIDTLHKINGKWFLIKKGMWNKTTGIVEYKGKDFFVQGGKWQSQETLYKKSGKLLAIKGGKWTKEKTIVKYDGKKYYCNKGYAQTSYSGKVTIGKKKYTVKKGIIK